jgi:hypothetical protein
MPKEPPSPEEVAAIGHKGRAEIQENARLQELEDIRNCSDCDELGLIGVVDEATGEKEKVKCQHLSLQDW